MRHAVVMFAISLAAMAMSAAAADKAKYSPDPLKRPFHRVHIQKLKMECSTCHAAEQTDVLDMGKHRSLRTGMPGPVDRHMCLSCHDKSNKPAWYGGAAK